MPFILIMLGALVADLAWQGSANIVQAGTLVRGELFGGNDPFYKWLGAIILLGLLGYAPQGRGLSTAFLILILLAIILSNRNFASFTKLIQKV